MQKVILTGFAAIALLASTTAHAQPAPPQQVTVNLTIQPAQWLVVGAGVLVGAAVLDIVLPSNVAFVVGGAIGGYLANSWYTGQGVQIQTSAAPKT